MAIIMVILVGTIVFNSFRDPLVILKSDGTNEFLTSHREEVSVGEKEVQKFTKEFVSMLYTWKEFDASFIKKQVSPFVEEELLGKILAAQTQRYVKELKNKKMSQEITSVTVVVQSDKVIARFDRVLKIEGVPVVIPTELTLSMLQDVQTRTNPMGIYISGITEHEGTK